MCNFNFACHFVKVEDGTEIIKCRDIPELLSWPADGEKKRIGHVMQLKTVSPL